MKDILLKGGLVIDPKQQLHTICNVLLQDGKIKEITEEERTADLIIDCRNKVVTPGFIDIHMHETPYDVTTETFSGSIFHSMILMGVTTAVGGNCGDNVMDPAVYLDAVDRQGIPVNLAMLVGHTYLRRLFSDADRYTKVDRDTVENMRKEGKRLLDKGCIGISFGLKYVPGTDSDEIFALAELCKKDHKLVAAHVRQDVDGVFSAAQELAEIGRRTKAKVQFSHIGSMGGYGQMQALLQMIEAWRNEGIDMLCDCYPYDAFSTAIGETTYDEGFLQRYHADYSSVMICSGPHKGQRCTKELFDEIRKTHPETYTVGYFMKKTDIDLALKSDFVMIGSDGVRDGDEGHPRGAGTYPRVFCQYVKKDKLSIDEAIKKMTWMPAERLGLTNKGNLCRGSDGDVVVLDMDHIQDKATYENPALAPEGIEYVLIGGQVAAKHGKILIENAGRSVRK